MEMDSIFLNFILQCMITVCLNSFHADSLPLSDEVKYIRKFVNGYIKNQGGDGRDVPWYFRAFFKLYSYRV